MRLRLRKRGAGRGRRKGGGGGKKKKRKEKRDVNAVVRLKIESSGRAERFARWRRRERKKKKKGGGRRGNEREIRIFSSSFSADTRINAISCSSRASFAFRRKKMGGKKKKRKKREGEGKKKERGARNTGGTSRPNPQQHRRKFQS